MSYRLVKNQIGGVNITLEKLINIDNGVYIISSHGLSSTKHAYVVSDNTYIISLTKSTQNLCGLKGDQINACRNYDELIKLLNSHKSDNDNSNNLYIYGPGEIIALPEIVNTGILSSNNLTDKMLIDEAKEKTHFTEEVITISDKNNDGSTICFLTILSETYPHLYYVKSSISGQTPSELQEKINNYYDNLINPIREVSMARIHINKKTIRNVLKKILKQKLKIIYIDNADNKYDICRYVDMDQFFLSGLLKFTNNGIEGYDESLLRGNFSVFNNPYDEAVELEMLQDIIIRRDNCLVKKSEINMAHKIHFKTLRWVYRKLKENFPYVYKFILFSLIENHYTCNLDTIISSNNLKPSVYILNMCRGFKSNKSKFDKEYYIKINKVIDRSLIEKLSYPFTKNTLISLNNINQFIFTKKFLEKTNKPWYQHIITTFENRRTEFNKQIFSFSEIENTLDNLSQYFEKKNIADKTIPGSFDLKLFNTEFIVDNKDNLFDNISEYIKVNIEKKIIIDLKLHIILEDIIKDTDPDTDTDTESESESESESDTESESESELRSELDDDK